MKASILLVLLLTVSVQSFDIYQMTQEYFMAKKVNEFWLALNDFSHLANHEGWDFSTRVNYIHPVIQGLFIPDGSQWGNLKWEFRQVVPTGGSGMTQCFTANSTMALAILMAYNIGDTLSIFCRFSTDLTLAYWNTNSFNSGVVRTTHQWHFVDRPLLENGTVIVEPDAMDLPDGNSTLVRSNPSSPWLIKEMLLLSRISPRWADPEGFGLFYNGPFPSDDECVTQF